MKILIKGKDYTELDLNAEGTMTFQCERLVSGDLNGIISKTVAWAFLCDVEDGRYKDFVQEVKKPWGDVDEKKKTIIKRKTKNIFMFQGVVGVLRNKKFNPTEHHRDDIEEYLKINGFETSGEGDLSLFFDDYFDITLQIGSRFDNNDRQFFLESMFADEPFDIKNSENEIPPNDESILDFLALVMFRQQLQSAYENGPYRKYVKYEMNDSKLRGIIEISRHIKNNIGLDNGKVAYSYRENTADNHITHLIIHAFEHALKFFPEYSYSIFFSGDKPISSIISDLRNLAPSFDVANVRIDMSKSDRVIDHPYYYRYEALRKTCLMLLRFDGLSMFDGTDEDILGILFYIPTLWENFLERQFRRLLSKPYASQMEAQYLSKVYVKDDNMGNNNTFPDYVFFLDKNKTIPLMVLDAKFKQSWAQEYGTDTLPELGDFTKCVRDMCALGARYVGVIFPKNTDENIDDRKEYEISACNKSKFYTIPVKVPDSSENGYSIYSEWIEKFSNNINSAVCALSDILNEAERDPIRDIYTKIINTCSLGDKEIEILKQVLGIY